MVSKIYIFRLQNDDRHDNWGSGGSVKTCLCSIHDLLDPPNSLLVSCKSEINEQLASQIINSPICSFGSTDIRERMKKNKKETNNIVVEKVGEEKNIAEEQTGEKKQRIQAEQKGEAEKREAEKRKAEKSEAEKSEAEKREAEQNSKPGGASSLAWIQDVEDSEDTLVAKLMIELEEAARRLPPREKLAMRDGNNKNMETLRLLVLSSIEDSNSLASKLECSNVPIFSKYLKRMSEAVAKGAWSRLRTSEKLAKTKVVETTRDMARNMLEVAEAMPRFGFDVAAIQHQKGRKVDNLRQVYTTIEEMLRGAPEEYKDAKYKVKVDSLSVIVSKF